MELEYKENLPPLHQLQVINHGKYKLHQQCFKKMHSEVLTLKYDFDDQFIALGCKDGSRMIYCPKQHKIVEKYQCLNENSVTSVKWRPKGQSSFKILASTDSQGNLTYWHIPTMKKVFTLREDNNSILCMDFAPKAVHFATAGKDANIRVYDQQTKSLAITLKNAQWNNVGHQNKVFAVKFVDDNTLISGGWDSVIHIWDVRQAKSIRHFLGPSISGQSVDYQDGKILVGCYAAKNQLQVWDFSKCQKIEQIDWTGSIEKAAYLYTAQYSRHNLGLIGAGSTGSVAQVRLYQADEKGEKMKHRLVNQIKGVNQSVFSFDFSRNHQNFAFSTAHHGFYVYQYKTEK